MAGYLFPSSVCFAFSSWVNKKHRLGKHGCADQNCTFLTTNCIGPLARKAGLRMTVVAEMPCGACGRTSGKGSFDFANRFEGRIGLLRSGRQGEVGLFWMGLAPGFLCVLSPLRGCGGLTPNLWARWSFLRPEANFYLCALPDSQIPWLPLLSSSS